jgi:hypothetical protein
MSCPVRHGQNLWATDRIKKGWEILFSVLKNSVMVIKHESLIKVVMPLKQWRNTKYGIS